MIAWGRAIVSPLLSERARATASTRPRRASGSAAVDSAGVRRANHLDDRLRPRADVPFPTREQQNIHRGVTSLVQLLGDEMEERAARPPASISAIRSTTVASPNSASRCRPRSGQTAERSRSCSGARSATSCRRSWPRGRRLPTRLSFLRPMSRPSRRWRPARVCPASVRGSRLGRRSRHLPDVRRHDSSLQPRRRRVHCLHRPVVGRGSLELWLDGVSPIRSVAPVDERSLKQPRSHP